MNINDRDLLAKTLQAEAGNQGLGGMLAAGSVIMNRTKTPGYGSGLRGVILKPGQFSAWNSLTGYAGGEQGQDMLNMRPSASAYRAADKLLTGDYQDQTGGATHYYNDAISNPKWGQKRAGGDWKRIGDHIFGFADAGRGKRSPQATTSTQGAAPMMQQEEKPRGLLGGLGIQKMQEGAPGETGQRFYERDSFKDTAALLAQGFGRMGIMGMEEIADDIAKQRTEAKAKNKTVEYLRKAGRDDLADAVANNVLGGKEAAGIMLAKPAAGEIREINNKLVRVMPDGSVTELYASDTPAELTADMREYNLAKEQGFAGSFIEFIQAQKGGGLQIKTNPDGTTEIIQGGPATAKLTEGQSKATGFFARSDEANNIMSELEMEGTELRNVISGAIPFGNYLRTPEGQKFDQAKRNFINAILRQESGAAIGPSEFASAELQYFPQPGDSLEVIAQKKANRKTAVNALKVAAGSGAGAIGALAPTSGGVTDDPLGLRN